MSLIRDVLDGVKTAIEHNGRIVSLGNDLEKLADKVDRMDTRLVRLETIIEIVKPTEGAVLRIAPAKND